MKFKITTPFCWYKNHTMIVKMYCINGKPFTFDELPDDHLQDEELIEEANGHNSFEEEDLYKNYNYLNQEQLHPSFFPIELENPDQLPDDLKCFDIDGDVTS